MFYLSPLQLTKQFKEPFYHQSAIVSLSMLLYFIVSFLVSLIISNPSQITFPTLSFVEEQVAGEPLVSLTPVVTEYPTLQPITIPVVTSTPSTMPTHAPNAIPTKLPVILPATTSTAHLYSTLKPNLRPTTPPYSDGFNCDCSKTCPNLSCVEAQYQLNVCGCTQRDADDDGTACDVDCQ